MEKHTDVNITTCEGQVFKCHRLVLSAASEYFDNMFAGFRANRVKFSVQDIDSGTFKEVLQFIYRGNISAIDDGNVYNFLRVSDTLKLSAIERQCVQYLTEESTGILLDNALEIFLFACANQKKSLISATSRFILAHLDHLSENNAFKEIPSECLSALLMFFRPASLSRENELLEAIFRWVSHSAGTDESKKSSFMEHTQNIRFRNISSKSVVEYFDKNITKRNVSSRRDRHDDSVPSVSDVNSGAGTGKLSLHVFVNTELESNRGRKTAGVDYSPRSNVLTLQKCNDDIDWNLSSVMVSIKCELFCNR